ncbi:hypothetical protein HMPREF3034_01182 [Prevotella sp. DNF00663]|uniref:HU family DNA-binding protein n=1 Tax=Prevotella sp. DNF00663 TaxID=1384078 RepID=UPI000785850B|nr:hypothetical protein [Prevotella sp. DNF00663]KXB83526.1 hypothetical protein HMPREF3034_01182 [Prevotella sp. DNF00663]
MDNFVGSRMYRVKEQFFEEDGVLKKKFYAMPYERETLHVPELLDRMGVGVARRVGILYGWNCMVAAIQEALERGYAVSMDGLGRLSVSCSSNPVDKANDVTPSTVRAKRIVFKADKRLREVLLNAKFVKV